jgi:VanZ family protein
MQGALREYLVRAAHVSPVRASQLTPRAGRARLLWLWLPVAVYAAAIFIVSSMSHPPLPEGISDKPLHGAAYAGMAILVLRALAGAELAGVTGGTSLSTMVLATLYGASDEAHQFFVPGRTCDWHDLLADAVGAATGVALIWLIALARPRRRKGTI